TSPSTALAVQEEGTPLLLTSLDEKSLAPTSPNSLTMTDPLEHALLPISSSLPKSFQRPVDLVTSIDTVPHLLPVSHPQWTGITTHLSSVPNLQFKPEECHSPEDRRILWE
ncbi:hypothetical protein KI387_004041, partial [Taxus chinensis]